MISNFSTEQSLKVLHRINIPDPPLLLEPISGFWFFLCFGCLVSLGFQGEWLAFLLISMPFIITLNYLANRYLQIAKLNYYKRNVRAIRRIIETPTLVKSDQIATFQFITCSDRIILDLEKMLELSIQNS